MTLILIGLFAVAIVNAAPTKSGKAMRRVQGKAFRGGVMRPLRALGTRSRTSGIGWWGRAICAAHDRADAARAAGKPRAARRWAKAADLMIGDLQVLRCHVAGCDWSMASPQLRVVVEHLRTHRTAEPAAAAPVDEPAPAPISQPDEPHLRLVANPEPPADTSSTGSAPTSGGNAMAIDTTTGGEVTDLETLQAELSAILRESTAELDDARADAQRAAEDGARIERMVSSLSVLRLPDQALNPIRGMGDSYKVRVEAAYSRAAAAESRYGQAAEALEAIKPHLQIKELADAVGGVADRRLYGAS